MELNRKHAIVGLALVGMLLLLMPMGAAWADTGDLEIGSAVFSVTLLNADKVPVNVPIVNSPFFYGAEEVTYLAISLTVDASGTLDVNWASISIVARFYIIPYLGNVEQFEQKIDQWDLLIEDFTYNQALGIYQYSSGLVTYLLDDLPLTETSMADDGTITWKFKVKAWVTGFVLNFDGEATNAEPYTGITEPWVLTTPPGGTQFSFDADLNTWFP